MVMYWANMLDMLQLIIRFRVKKGSKSVRHSLAFSNVIRFRNRARPRDIFRIKDSKVFDSKDVSGSSSEVKSKIKLYKCEHMMTQRSDI